MRPLQLLAVLLVFGLLAGCGDDSGATPDAAPPPPDVPVDVDNGVVPRVEPTSCRFVVASSLGLTEGVGYACGDLVVAENRAAPTRHIRLHYIRFTSTAATNRATIYLDGGPGGGGQGIVNYAAQLGPSFLAGLMVDGDFLVIGQRGTALSIPYLDCQDEDCDDFAAMADLPSYNTANNADDVDDLRAALGLDKLNLYGISYGSRLGLEVLRRHGDRVRAAVIEGLVPAQIVWPAAISSSFYGALTALHTACADAGACGTTYGDLVAKFISGVDTLNTSPVSINVQGNDFPLDGYTYAHLLFRLMYARSSYPWLPLVINDLAVSRTDRVNDFMAEAFLSTRSNVSMGLYYSVVCGEMFNPPDASAVEAANSGVPTAIRDIFDSSFYSLSQTCASWPKGDLQATLAQPVTSSVRTLISSGRLDPITPPSFGAVVATGLANSVVVIHEGSGHGATLQSPCATQNLHEFLADPDTAHDTTCAATITNNYMVPGAFVAPPLSWARIRAELAIAPALPLARDATKR